MNLAHCFRYNASHLVPLLFTGARLSPRCPPRPIDYWHSVSVCTLQLVRTQYVTCTHHLICISWYKVSRSHITI